MRAAPKTKKKTGPKAVKAEPKAAPKQVAIKPAAPPSPIDTVLAKYRKHGWVAFCPPGGSTNDIIAQNGRRLHFVQVTTSETKNDSKYTGLAQNTFIQNAFSNAACPVYAIITDGRPGAIIFINVNENVRVLIRGKMA